tara:strand:- start:3480 stop:3794 length:315 start_codon:yes stop_codon:yes gene_type:complete
MKNSMVIAAVVGVCLMPNLVRADMSRDLCNSQLPIVAQAIRLRQNGVPIATAEGMADSAFRIDKNLFGFLISAIRYAYENPEGASKSLNNGRMLEICMKNVRGY